jgi:beta-mannosidase
MMSKTISLNGEWMLCYNDLRASDHEEALRRFENEKLIPYAVPGDVHTALIGAGIIEEPLYALNSKDCGWMEEKEYWLFRRFDHSVSDAQAVLTFDGLDLTAKIWLNGIYLGEHNNAFYPAEYDVSGIIRDGGNLLVVRLDEGVHDVRDKDITFTEGSWEASQPYRVWIRKPQYVYGWDWTVWLPTVGIWRGVAIVERRGAYIDDIFMRSVFSKPARACGHAEISVEADCRVSDGKAYTLNYRVLMADGSLAAQGSVPADRKEFMIRIENPQLWWPNGAGEPYLYDVFFELTGGGDTADSKHMRHGFRTVEIEQRELGDGHVSFTFLVNGEPVFIKGANWIVNDALVGRVTDDKTAALLLDAKNAHMNMMRVWGGGIYESGRFMELCDEYGILVWHDFMFACIYYPDHDGEFMESVKTEAVYNIKRLRNHPSLFGWIGNNEIQEMHQAISKRVIGREFNGEKIFHELLPGLTAQYDPDRTYRPTSPYGGEEHAGDTEGDQHIWHFTHRSDYAHYLDLWRFTSAFDMKFLSEFGIIGAMNHESAEKCISGEMLKPGTEEWLHHSNDFNDHRILDIVIRHYWGDGRTDSMTVKEYILHSQVIQAEIMRHIYDDLRCKKFRCSGVLLWTWNDAMGMHNWSVMDYYCSRRPIYYYLKRASAPYGISMQGYEAQVNEARDGYAEYYKSGALIPLSVYGINDTLEPGEFTMEYTVFSVGGEELAHGSRTRDIPANAVRKFHSIGMDFINGYAPEELFVYAELYCNGQAVSDNRYFLAPYRHITLPPPDVDAEITKLAPDTVELKLRSSEFVWMLHIATPDGVIPDDNDFDLIPNREKRVTVKVPDAEKYVPELSSINGAVGIIG